MSYGRYKVIFFCKAEYDSEGVAFTKLMEDFPVELGDDVFYDSIDVYKPWGRDPVDKMPLWVDQVVSRYKKSVTTHGVQSLGASYSPEQGAVPAASLVEGWVTNAAVLAAIDAVPKYHVLGIFPEDIAGDPIPESLRPYATDTLISDTRWTKLRNGLVSVGMDADLIDTWRGHHPAATPMEVAKAFVKFIR